MSILRAIVKVMIVALSLFSTNLIAGDSQVENIKPNILSKTYLFDYGSYAYDITITSDKSLH